MNNTKIQLIAEETSTYFGPIIIETLLIISIKTILHAIYFTKLSHFSCESLHVKVRLSHLNGLKKKKKG